jgi:hypothetical protein
MFPEIMAGASDPRLRAADRAGFIAPDAPVDRAHDE